MRLGGPESGCATAPAALGGSQGLALDVLGVSRHAGGLEPHWPGWRLRFGGAEGVAVHGHAPQGSSAPCHQLDGLGLAAEEG